MKISDIDLDKHVLIIAEAGNNHEGNYVIAEKMISLAAEAGADAVKFQTFITEHYVSPADRNRFDLLKSFELTENEFERLKKAADDAGILFISTPFDLKSAEFLNNIVSAFKISSGDSTFYPLIKKIAGFDKPIILSSGLTDLEQLNYSKTIIEKTWEQAQVEQEVAVLHCVSSYPVPLEETNLAAISVIKDSLGCTVGYSDHSLGIEAATLSVAAGARIVEKHFTTDKTYSNFRDHQLSADPEEFSQLVKSIRRVEKVLGSSEKVVQKCEEANIKTIRRSIAAAKDMVKGHVVRPEDITWIRPATGIPPGMEKSIIGKILQCNISKGELFDPDMLTKVK